MLMKKIQVVVAVFALIALLRPLSASATEFKIVVNASSSVTGTSAKELSRIFLKQSTKWSNGESVVPLDQHSSSEIRIEFSTAIHGRSAADIHAYWQRMIFSGRAVPPLEEASDSAVLAAVRADPRVVGYVSRSTDVGSGVKVVRVGEF